MLRQVQFIHHADLLDRQVDGVRLFIQYLKIAEIDRCNDLPTRPIPEKDAELLDTTTHRTELKTPNGNFPSHLHIVVGQETNKGLIKVEIKTGKGDLLFRNF